MIRNLFLIDNEKIAVFRYRNENIEPIKKEGEVFFTIDEDFWVWWEKTVEYIKNDELDLCFVWNKKNDLIFNHSFFVENLEDTIWNISIAKKILDQYMPNSKLINKQETHTQNSFYTNASLQIIKDTNINDTTLKQESRSQKYFRQKREKQAQEREDRWKRL
ncbi:hypothetical protein KJQ73_02815 [Campylobacter lari]|uniref:hypothetical protein n=1 Tax=Campylobacter lari TaxID=201 RepID=UPI00126E165C|nr:hypothetical protein [Campylobacter lari]EAK0951999.1 hypothetical protein [Campylobacter lari]EGK8021982.1 hypothetical protein [Campylobacter lari]MBT0818391.1 hypothetical protein [Campylobacter lari]MBT0832861.1 hypothetical protein [Campylobacter lari]